MSPKQGMQHTKGMKPVPELTSNDVCLAHQMQRAVAV